MFNTAEERNSRSLDLLKIFIGLFFITYALWYFGGGPEEWDEKIRGEINAKSIKENIAF